MSLMCKINKSEILGGPLSFFDALFGRCTAFYGHFLVDVVTPEGSTCISSSVACLAESAGSPAFGVGLFAWRSRGGLAFGVGLFAWWGRGGGWGDLWAVSQVKSLTRMWCLAFRGLSCS